LHQQGITFAPLAIDGLVTATAGGAFTRREVAMTTARLVLCCSVLYLLPASTSAEIFEVWEDSGDIFAKEIATGEVRNLTAVWDYPAWEPNISAYTAVFTTSAPEGISIRGYDLDDRFPRESFPVFYPTMGGAPSEPQVSVVNPAGLGDYWCAFRYQGGIWAQHIQPPVINSDAYEALADYAGIFDVEANSLIYEGGIIALADQTPPETPEPTTTILFLTAIAIVLIGFRRHG